MADASQKTRWKLSDLMGRLSAVLPVRDTNPGEGGPAPAPVLLSVREDNTDESDAAAMVPRTLRVAAAFSWRTLVVVGLVAVLLWGASKLTIVIMPVAIALTITVLLEPLVSWMRRTLRFPSSLAATVGLLVFFAVVAGALSQAAAELIQQVPQLATQAADGFRALLDAITHNEYLKNGPLKLDTTVLSQAAEQLRSELVTWLNTNKETLATGALNITSSVGTLATSGLTMLFCLFFFLKEGRSIWLWCVRLLPAPARVPVHESAIRGWSTFGSYVRTQIQVAAIDAVGIALGVLPRSAFGYPDWRHYVLRGVCADSGRYDVGCHRRFGCGGQWWPDEGAHHVAHHFGGSAGRVQHFAAFHDVQCGVVAPGGCHAGNHCRVRDCGYRGRCFLCADRGVH